MWYTLIVLVITTALVSFIVLRQRWRDDFRPPRREWYDVSDS